VSSCHAACFTIAARLVHSDVFHPEHAVTAVSAGSATVAQAGAHAAELPILAALTALRNQRNLLRSCHPLPLPPRTRQQEDSRNFCEPSPRNLPHKPPLRPCPP